MSDFGLAILEDEATRGNMGTFRWMAPEVARREGSTKSSDVYSFSMLMYELITHQVRLTPLLPQHTLHAMWGRLITSRPPDVVSHPPPRCLPTSSPYTPSPC